MAHHAACRNALEIQFEGESGFGTGVTQGFYSSVAATPREDQRRPPVWLADAADAGGAGGDSFIAHGGALFPRPLAADAPPRRSPPCAPTSASSGGWRAASSSSCRSRSRTSSPSSAAAPSCAPLRTRRHRRRRLRLRRRRRAARRHRRREAGREGAPLRRGGRRRVRARAPGDGVAMSPTSGSPPARCRCPVTGRRSATRAAR